MGKVLKGIDGERFPLIGGIAEYHVTFAETVDVETINDKEILWQVYWANEYSGYEKVPFSGQKTGRLTTYKFLQNLQGKNLQLKATYKNETVELHITPQANGEVKIIDVFFLDVEYKMLDASNLKYLNSVNLQIYTLNMLGKYVEFKIYDTVNGRDVEVAKSSEPLKIVQTNGIVKTKRAILLSPAMYMQTQQDMSASEHHYKVKVWEKNDETNFYEEELKVKNELGQMSVPKDSQTPVKTGTSEPDKKKEEEKDCKCCRIDEENFFVNYQKEFPQYDKKGNLLPMKESLKDRLKKVFKGIREYYSKENKDCDIRKIAYMLATAELETGHTFNPVEEANWLSWSVRKKYFEGMYDPVLGKNEKRKKMALENENTKQGDGVKYFGRGFVQITWKKNYRRMGEKFGVDLVNSPEKALNHDIAIKIMIYGCEEGKFSGKSLGDYINSEKTDYYNARRVINGTDRADIVQEYAKKMEKCLKIKKCKD
jgi:predicted chitinase